jgi:hypothetical protein
MNSNFEENQNVEQKLYESPNMGTILKPRSLRTKKTTHMTLGVFNQNWSKKISLD